MLSVMHHTQHNNVLNPHVIGSRRCCSSVIGRESRHPGRTGVRLYQFDRSISQLLLHPCSADLQLSSVFVCAHVYVFVCVHVYVFVCAHVYVFVCAHVFVFVCFSIFCPDGSD